MAIDKIVIATTNLKEDDVIENLVKNLKVDCFRGDRNEDLILVKKIADLLLGKDNSYWQRLIFLYIGL